MRLTRDKSSWTSVTFKKISNPVSPPTKLSIPDALTHMDSASDLPSSYLTRTNLERPFYRAETDLTGQVVKTSTYGFARGRNADLWKGTLVTRDSHQFTEVGG